MTYPESSQRINVEDMALEKRKPGIVDIQFLWQAEPKVFAGLTQQQLTHLTYQAADFFHIPAETRNRIHFYFGDHVVVEHPEEGELIALAHAIPNYDPYTGSLIDVTVVINRSKELYDEENKGHLGLEYYETIAAGSVGLHLRYPWEEAAWKIAEELHHAHVLLRLESEDKTSDALENYKRYATSLLKKENVKNINIDALNVVELAGTRQALRFLIALAQEIAPERIPVYEEVLQRSLQTRSVVINDLAFEADSVYIPTGYQS